MVPRVVDGKAAPTAVEQSPPCDRPSATRRSAKRASEFSELYSVTP